MGPVELSKADHALVEAAESALRERYSAGRHRTGAAVQAASGAVYTAVSFKADTGVADLHAEPLAVARAELDGEQGVKTIAAVQPVDDDPAHTRVVSACGACREFLRTYAPNAWLVVEENDEFVKYPLSELLPAR